MRYKSSLLIILSIVLCLTLFVAPVVAQTSAEYYSGLFNSWGIRTDILPSQKADQPATKDDLQSLYDLISGETVQKDQPEESPQTVVEENRYLLVLEAQQAEAQKLQEAGSIPSYQKIILISKAYPQDFYLNQSSASAKLLADLEPKVIDTKTYYTIPEVYLTTPELQTQTAKYFKAVAKAEQALPTKSKDVSMATASALMAKLKESSMLESAIYAGVILLIFVAFYGLFTTLVRNPVRLLHKDLYQQLLSRTVGFISKYHAILLFSFVLFALFYIPILYALTIKARLLGNPAYVVNYITTTLNPLTMSNYLTSQNIFRLGFMFYNYVLAILAVILLIPRLCNITTISDRKFSSVNLKTSFIKWAIPSVVLFTVILLVFFPVDTLIGLLALSGVFIAGLVWYIHARKLAYAQLFTGKEKRILFGLLTLGLALIIAWPAFQKSRPVKYAYEPLIGIKDEVVMLPYSKKWGQNVLFNEQYYPGDSLIFADGYLIYASDVAKIVNKPLKDFEPSVNSAITTNSAFTLVVKDTKKTMEALLKKPTLVDYFKTPDFSPVFMLADTDSQVLYDKNLMLSLTFNCTKNPAPAVVKVETVSLNRWAKGQEDQNQQTSTNQGGKQNRKQGQDENDDEEQKQGQTANQGALDALETQSTEILNFPGCEQKLLPETLQVPLDVFLLPENRPIVRLRGIDTKILTGAKLYADDQEVPLTFINAKILDETTYTLIYQSPATNPSTITTESATDRKTTTENLKNPATPKSNELTAYSTEVKEETVFDLTQPPANNQPNDTYSSYLLEESNPQGFDISSPINILMKQGRLNNPFIIWSSRPNEIIKTED